jgi:hypothetical protein
MEAFQFKLEFLRLQGLFSVPGLAGLRVEEYDLITLQPVLKEVFESEGQSELDPGPYYIRKKKC